MRAFEYEGPGFWLSIDPAMRVVAPGYSTTYSLSIEPVGIFTAAVSLQTSSPSPSLTLSLRSTSTMTVPSQATLVVTNSHASPLLPGLWHTLLITGTGDGLEQVLTADLLVGGVQLYLPTVLRSSP